MTNLRDAQIRPALISERIRQRTDLALRELIAQYQETLTFHPLDDLMISEQAWRHVEASEIDIKFVFAHPELLREHPAVSQHYRGLALLPRKRVTDIAGSVDSWEDGTRKTPIPEQRGKDVARLYNAVISSIIEGAANWTLENGYRNIIATMGIGLEGTFRNIIGKDAEDLIRNRIKSWLASRRLIIEHNDTETEFRLPSGYYMRYGSEPDVRFQQEQNGILQTVATIEIKGGKDPAGALERLGAMQKSFEETPPGCVNMLIAGVVTPEMESRLENMGVTEVFLLDDLAHDSEDWIDFLNEVFHYTVRVTDSTITG